MNKQKLKHLVGLLGTIAIPLLTVWGDVSTALDAKIAVTVSLLIPLVWSNPAEQAKVTTALLAGIPVATIVVSAIASRMSGTAAGGAAVSVVLAVLTQLRLVLVRPPVVIPQNAEVTGPPAQVVPLGPGIVVPNSTPTPVTVANPTGGQVAARAKDGGKTSVQVLGSLAFAAFLAVLALFCLCGPARAEQFGGCNESRSLCAGPAVAVTLGSFNLATNKFAGGLSPGVGYGITYATDRWYATGLAAYLSFSIGGGEPNNAMPSLLLSFANYVRAGAGVSITETGGPVQTQWRLLFGLGADFGGTPSYVRAAVAQ